MFNIKVKKVKPLKNQILEVEFSNGEIKLYDTKQLFEEFEEYRLLENDDIFNLVKVDCGGSAVAFTDEIEITEYELYTNGYNETKTVNRVLQKNGQGRYGAKVGVPLAWLQKLGVTEDNQELNLVFTGDKIIIKK